jgi:hypothetical protein
MLITNTTIILDAPKAENVVTNRTLKHALMWHDRGLKIEARVTRRPHLRDTTQAQDLMWPKRPARKEAITLKCSHHQRGAGVLSKLSSIIFFAHILFGRMFNKLHNSSSSSKKTPHLWVVQFIFEICARLLHIVETHDQSA